MRWELGDGGAPWLDVVILLAEARGDGHDVEVAARPVLPASPWLRVHQAASRDAALAWLDERLRH